MNAFFDVALPVFGLIVVGFAAGKAGTLGGDAVAVLNRYVYFLALPALFLVAMADVRVGEVLNLPYVLSVFGVQVVLFSTAMVVARVAFPKRLAGLALHAVTSVFSNSAYMGIPLALLAFGQRAALPAVVATVLNAAGLLVLASMVIQMDRAGTGSPDRVRGLLKATAGNPLLLGALSGMLLSAAGLPLPRSAHTLLKLLGDTSGPCALVAMGMFLCRISLPKGRVVHTGIEIGWIAILKLVVHPLATWLVATRVFALEGVWAATAVIMASLPTGALTFVLAKEHEVFVDQTAAVILITTLTSVLTTTAVLSLYTT